MDKKKLNDKKRVFNDECDCKVFYNSTKKVICLIYHFTFWKHLSLLTSFIKTKTLQGKLRGHLSDEDLKSQIRIACNSVKVIITKAGKDVLQQKLH